MDRTANINGVSENATFTLSVDGGATCTGTFTVIAVGGSVATSNATCSDDGEITVVSPLGSGNFNYSIDSTTFQASNTFLNVATGVYDVYIRDVDVPLDCPIGNAIVDSNQVAAYAISASCSNGIANDDAYLQISSADGDSYHFSAGSTFNDNGGADTYTNATAITTTLVTFGSLPNPAAPTDYTIRVYNGANDCFTDVVVNLQPQDCNETGCNCAEYIYLNDRNTGVVYKFEVNPTDGSLTEVTSNGNRWYPIDGSITELPSPHGLATDLNGFLYIGELSKGNIRKLNCEGEIFPESEFEIISGGQNFGSIGNVLYVSVTTEDPDGIYAYDLCTGAELGFVTLNDSPTIALNNPTAN